MGRIETPQKPPGSLQDPAQSAKVAAAKQLRADIANPSTSTPTPPSPDTVRDSVEFLKPNDWKTILDRVIDAHPEARTTIQAYCDTPLGAVDRPCDFGALEFECDAIHARFSSDDWKAVDRRYYEEDKEEFLAQERERFDVIIRQLWEVCKARTNPTASKIQAIMFLFDLIILINTLDELRGDRRYNEELPDHQIQLLGTVYDTIGAAMGLLSVKEIAQLEAEPNYEASFKRFRALGPRVEGVARGDESDEEEEESEEGSEEGPEEGSKEEPQEESAKEAKPTPQSPNVRLQTQSAADQSHLMTFMATLQQQRRSFPFDPRLAYYVRTVMQNPAAFPVLIARDPALDEHLRRALNMVKTGQVSPEMLGDMLKFMAAMSHIQQQQRGAQQERQNQSQTSQPVTSQADPNEQVKARDSH